MQEWGKIMATLDCRPIPSRLEPNEKRIGAFEKHIGAALAADYRDFLHEHGGVWVSAQAPIREPTPFGAHVTIEAFYGFMNKKPLSCDLKWVSDLAEGAPVAIPIANGAFGSQIFLFTSDQKRLGIAAGAVYCRDGECRSTWTDAMFRKSFKNLAPDIMHYLDLRRKNKLPKKP